MTTDEEQVVEMGRLHGSKNFVDTTEKLIQYLHL